MYSYLLFIALAFCLGESFSAGARQKHVGMMDRETIQVIFQLVSGEFDIPVRDRTRLQSNAYMRWYRNRDKFRLVNRQLYWDDKKIVHASAEKKLIIREHKETKGSGARKLLHRMRSRFTGLTESRIQSVLNENFYHQRIHGRFINKPKLRPIRAKEVHERHQIDLVDMGEKHSVNTDDGIYRYVLTIIDVFSRFIWLAPLVTKSSSSIAKSLHKIYTEFGPPMIIQCDQGTEFKGAVNSLANKLRIKVIRSRPYHPQSQGKIERSHRTLRNKIAYDMTVLARTSINWVKRLASYAKVLNNDPKRVLCNKSPFQIFFGRDNRLVTALNTDSDSAEVGEIVHKESLPTPLKSDILASINRSKNTRKKAARATQKANQYMVDRQSRLNPPTRYKFGQKVLFRLPLKKGKFPSSRRMVLPGRIIRVGKGDRYKIAYKTFGNSNEQSMWFSVTEIRNRKTCKKIHRDKFYIPINHKDRIDHFLSLGLTTIFDPLGDGDCQFSALADQLRRIGIHRSAETLRAEIVEELCESRHRQGLDHYSNFVIGGWEEYVLSMATHGTYGDHVTLTAAANLYGISVSVYSPGVSQHTVIRPHNITGYCPMLYLGYFPEGQGEHYVSLQPVPNNTGSESTHDTQSDFDTIDSISSCAKSPSSSDAACSQSRGSYLNHTPTNSTNDDTSDENIPLVRIKSRLQRHPKYIEYKSSQNIRLEHDAMIRNDESKPQLSSLPTEIIRKIFATCTGENILSFQKIRCVNKRFCEIIDSLPLPAIYLSPYIEPEVPLPIVSVNRLTRLAGTNSGLLLSLREMIPLPSCPRAWLQLRPKGTSRPGWYTIDRVYWRK